MQINMVFFYCMMIWVYFKLLVRNLGIVLLCTYTYVKPLNRMNADTCLAVAAGVWVLSASRISKGSEPPCFAVVPPTVEVMDMYLQITF